MIEAYPLAWPAGRPRIAYPAGSRFETTHVRACAHVLAEIRRLGGTNPIISTNIPLRNDGIPRANYRMPNDRGVAVYFTRRGRQMCFACDKWDQIHDNIYAIGKTIEALRGIERWGTGDMVEQAFNGFVALPAPKDPHEILGVRRGASPAEIDAAYRDKAKRLHPDKGGDADAMSELNAARQKLREQAA